MADVVNPLGAPTTNYGWTKPAVGADTDAWGGMINADLDGIDSTVKAVSNSVPAAAVIAPIMDGVAAVGTATAFARQDHVHPIDTSRASVAYVDAKPLAMNDNRIINGNFAVNQRTTVSGTALAATAYGHDRWKAGASGCTYTFTAALPDTTITITAGSLLQIIEGGNIEGGVYTLSWTGTAKARVYQGTATGTYVASPLITVSLTAGADTTVDFNAGTLTKVKFEIGSVATPYNRQSLAKSVADCQRYYQARAIDIWCGNITASNPYIYAAIIPVLTRAAPTVVLVDITNNGFPAGVPTVQNASINGFQALKTANVTGTGGFFAFSFTASAEL